MEFKKFGWTIMMCAAILSDGNGGYIDAFKDATDNWLEGWTNFDPQNTAY